MRGPTFECLFCKTTDRQAFRRIEHIIPESLGNDEMMLEPGFVCDTCNQYFGAKVENRMLNSPPFNVERTAFSVPTKKGKLPNFALDNNCVLSASGSSNQLIVVAKQNPQQVWKKISSGYIVPEIPPGYDDLLPRFVLKIGLELLLTAERIDPYQTGFDAARRYSRYGQRAGDWDVAWGIYPRRSDLYISSRVDAISPIHKHQLYQVEMGMMENHDIVLSFIYGQSVFACNLCRPSIMEYVLAFNMMNDFTLRCNWGRKKTQRLAGGLLSV